MAPLAALRNESHFDTSIVPKFFYLAQEFAPFHFFMIGHLCPKVNGKAWIEFGFFWGGERRTWHSGSEGRDLWPHAHPRYRNHFPPGFACRHAYEGRRTPPKTRFPPRPSRSNDTSSFCSCGRLGKVVLVDRQKPLHVGFFQLDVSGPFRFGGQTIVAETKNR